MLSYYETAYHFFSHFLCAGFQGIPGTSDMIGGHSMAMTNSAFNPTSTISPSHPGLHHPQLRPPPSQAMLLPTSHHPHHAAAAAAAMMMPHHAVAAAAASGHAPGGLTHPHHLHPSQGPMNPTDMSPHVLGHTC